MEKFISDKYDEIRIYEGGRIDYYLAKKNGKYGILDSKGNEITPIIMDEVHEMIDMDGCIPLVKDGKWGLVHFDIKGKFTTDESQAYIGSWYDFEK